jgi:tetratricopeptide (TPR) repeat protein
LNAAGSITRLRAALARFPDSPLLHLLLGDAYQVAERWPQAREAYDRASWLAPRWAKPHVNRGVLLLALDLPAEAIRAFEAALRLEPANGQARLLLADGQIKRGDTSAALRALEGVAGPPEVRADARTRIGQIYLNSGNPLAALPHFNAAQRLTPRSVAPLAGQPRPRSAPATSLRALRRTAPP